MGKASDNIRSRRKLAMVECMKKTLGVVTAAAEMAGIDRSVHYQWYLKDETYRHACDEIGEIALDFAESKLFKMIQKEEPSAVYFYLKTKGKRRGYIERVENVVAIADKTSIIEFLRDTLPLPAHKVNAIEGKIEEIKTISKSDSSEVVTIEE